MFKSLPSKCYYPYLAILKSLIPLSQIPNSHRVEFVLTFALAGFSAGEYVISGSAVGALIIMWFDAIWKCSTLNVQDDAVENNEATGNHLNWYAITTRWGIFLYNTWLEFRTENSILSKRLSTFVAGTWILICLCW